MLYLEMAPGKAAILGGSMRKGRVHSWLCGVLMCSVPSECPPEVWIWDFSGRMMERLGTLTAGNKDLNLASVILITEPRFPSVEWGQ